MSLNSAMQTGVSGLAANSQALSTVSNNIANVNTVGYKQSETEFETLVTGTGIDAAANSNSRAETENLASVPPMASFTTR